MQCPVCYHKNTRVMDTREIDNGKKIRRRRACKKCRYRFSTYEEMELLSLFVKKRDGHFEPYEREKIEKGVRLSLEKRPIENKDIEGIITKVEKEIAHHTKQEKININDSERSEQVIDSKIIGDCIVKELKKIDPVAYLRFASVYKSFDDIGEFRKEIKELQKI